MNEFDQIASGWDDDPMHIERSEAVAAAILKMLPLKKDMIALEYGAGTGLLSFLLKDHLGEITLMDNSEGMLGILRDKILRRKSHNLKPLFFNLEEEDYPVQFDCIFNQMVLHHVGDIDAIFGKFHQMLHQGGYLAIADLYPEDGSFHGPGFTGHMGFDPGELSKQMADAGFINIRYQECYTIKRESEGGRVNDYPVFLLVAEKTRS